MFQVLFHGLGLLLAVLLTDGKPDVAKGSQHSKTEVSVEVDALEHALRNELLGLGCSGFGLQAVGSAVAVCLRIQSGVQFAIALLCFFDGEFLPRIWSQRSNVSAVSPNCRRQVRTIVYET